MVDNSGMSQENLEKLQLSLKKPDIVHMFFAVEKLGNNLIAPGGMLRKLEKLSHLIHSIPKEIWPVDIGYEGDLENVTIESLLSTLRNQLDENLKIMNEMKDALDNAIKIIKD